MRGGGTTRVEATGSLNLTSVSTMWIDQRTFDCFANTTWTGTAGTLRLANGATFNNHPGAVFDIQSDADLDFSGGGMSFNNMGTYKKTGGNDISGCSAPFNNAGMLASESGTLSFSGGFTQTAGATQLSTGALTSSQTMNFNGGELRGSGSIAANISNGGATVMPGDSAGTMTINGTYTQSADGVLNIEIGGTGQGTQFDYLQVSGNVSLAGALILGRIDDFSPAANHAFEIVTGNSVSGEFALITGTSAGGNGLFLAPTYPGASVILTLKDGTPVIGPAPISFNGGGLMLEFTGIDDQNYRVDASTDLETWGEISTITLTGTSYLFVDPDADQFTRRFYRAVFLPR